MNDADLVCRAREGDPDAYTALVERYRDAIYGLAFHYLHDFEDARDVAQEAFIRAYLRLDQLREPARFGPWLRQVTVNECRMWRRRQRPEEALEQWPEPAASRDAIETRLAVRQALACLSEASRLTLTLFYMQRWSHREIAAFLEVPVTTVKSRLRNARARLREELLEMVEGTLKQQSLPADFATQVRQLLHGELVGSVAFSPDGKRLASGGAEDGSVKLWDAATGELVRSLSGHTWNVDTLCFSPDGRRLASAGADRIVSLWEVETGRLLATLGEGERQGSLAFSPDGSMLAAVCMRFAADYRSAYSRVVLWRVTSWVAMGELVGELTRRLENAPPELPATEGPRGVIYSVTFSPDGRQLATGSSVVENEVIVGGDVMLWDAGTHCLLRTIALPGFYVKAVAYSPDGRTLAAGCTQVESRAEGGWKLIASEVRLWDRESDTAPRTVARLEENACIQRVQFSPDGRRIVLERYRDSGDCEAELWDLETGQRLQAFPGVGEAQGRLAFSPDGRTLASAGAGASVQIWRRDPPSAGDG